MSKIATLLLVIGGINWGLIGLFDINVVAMLLGEMSVLTRLVYILVGASGLWVGYEALTKSS